MQVETRIAITTGRARVRAVAPRILASTLARIIASTIADDMFVQELDAGDLTVDRLKCIEAESHTFSWGKGGRAFIVNEAHGLRQDMIRKLLSTLEPIPEHCVWIFTTTKAAQKALFDDQVDARPLLSRCKSVALTTQGLCKAFAARIRYCMGLEGMDGEPLEYYESIMKMPRVGNSCREGFNVAEEKYLTRETA